MQSAVQRDWSQYYLNGNRTVVILSYSVTGRCGFRRQSAEEKELQRLQASLRCQPPQLKAGADDDDVADCRRQTSPTSAPFPLPQPPSTSLQALQSLQPWSDVAGSRSFAIV